jgi:hypothetical protein
MDTILDAMRARLAAQASANLIAEYHDDEPTTIARYVAAFIAAQGPQVTHLTVGQPGKVITSWQMDVYYLVPLADRRAAFRELARITPLVLADWLRNRRLSGIAVDTQVGQSQGRGQFVNVSVAGIEHRALLLPLFIETETLI